VYLVHEKTPWVDALAFKVLKIQFFTLIILAMLTSRERIEKILWVTAFSIGFYGIKGGIYTISTAGSGRVWGPPGGYFEGNNELGLTLVIIIPIFYYLLSVTTRVWLRYLIVASMVLCTIATLGTQSRGAFLSIAACAIFLWLKSKQKVLLSLVFIIAIPFAYQSMPQTWHDRMATIYEQKEENYDGSIQGRLNAWRMAINLASDQFFGGGFNATNRANFYMYAPNPENLVDSHSIYFQILGKHGWPGLFIYLSMYISALLLANKTIKKVKKHDDLLWAMRLSQMLQVSLIAFAVGGTFLGLAYFDLPFQILVTIAATYAIAMKELKHKEQQAADEKKQQEKRSLDSTISLSVTENKL